MTYTEMRVMVQVCQNYIYWLAKHDTHLNKCMMAILVDVMTRVERRTAGFVNSKGYLMKLKPHEKECLYYMRNDMPVRLLTAEGDNAVVKILEINL